jgi:hypothetical protein
MTQGAAASPERRAGRRGAVRRGSVGSLPYARDAGSA